MKQIKTIQKYFLQNCIYRFLFMKKAYKLIFCMLFYYFIKYLYFFTSCKIRILQNFILQKIMQVSVNNKKTIPIVFATNENYAPFAGVCINSIVKNSSKDYFYKIFVFHVGLSNDTIKKLNSLKAQNLSTECLNISQNLESIKSNLYSHSYFSNEMYYRILIPEVLSNYDKVIYLDCDMIILGDLSELFSFDLKSNCIGAVKNPLHKKMYDYIHTNFDIPPEKYINSGMLLINCTEFRKQKIKEKFFEEIKNHNVLRYPDQDLINIVCKNKILYLPMNWNYLWHQERLNKGLNQDLHLLDNDYEEYNKAKSNIKILHYTGDRKPWTFNAISGSDLFWNYASSSCFYDTIYKQFLKNNNKYQKIKFVFCEFENDYLNLTCSYNILNENNSDSYLYFINKNLHRPTIYYKRQIIVNDVLLTQRLFSIKIPLKDLTNNKTEIFFTINNKNVMFEYDKFFPLNGNQKSYFAYNGLLFFRNEKSLIIEKCNFFKRMRHELSYLHSLIHSKNKKFAYVRLCYFFTKKFMPKNIWLISDRPKTAGDNGEALFTYIRTHKSEYKKINPYFVVDKKSADYKRLKKLGHVIPLSSRKHKVFALHSSVKAVSQTDKELYDVCERNFVKDLLYKENRVFLQHGITKDDVSNLYSKFNHNFNLFVTAGIPEYESIVTNRNYGCGKSITKLTGFPRHDNLQNKTQKIIVINPTWRLNLWKNSIKEFQQSSYFKNWNEILKNKKFNLMLKNNGYKVVFVLHNNMEKFSECFYRNENIVIPTKKNYSQIFSEGALFVTDYSSNAFEFAYLRKPIIYFHFDKDTFFADHSYNKGYFDYEKNGFGEVTYCASETLDTIFSYIDSDCKIKDEYKKRINSFFKYNDNNNSKRVVEQILKLKR